jgi:hypothetical protein
MRIKNISFTYFIDYLGRRIHLLEAKGNSVYQSLANSMSPQFKNELIESEALLMDVKEFDWIIYSYGGLILSHTGYSMSILSKSEDCLYQPYLEAIQGV